jgi:hypothetical protein
VQAIADWPGGLASHQQDHGGPGSSWPDLLQVALSVKAGTISSAQRMLAKFRAGDPNASGVERALVAHGARPCQAGEDRARYL